MNVADAALTAGDPALAMHVTTALLTNDPRDAAAFVRQADALWQLGRVDEAMDSFRRAIAIAPDTPDGHLGLARLLLKRGQASEAETQLKPVLVKDPNNLAALVDIGIALDLLGRHEEAQKSYHQALVLSPGLSSAQINLGLSLALAGKGEAAAAALRPLATQPNAPEWVRHDLAVALAVDDKLAEAKHVIGNDLPSTEVDSDIARYRSMAVPGAALQATAASVPAVAAEHPSPPPADTSGSPPTATADPADDPIHRRDRAVAAAQTRKPARACANGQTPSGSQGCAAEREPSRKVIVWPIASDGKKAGATEASRPPDPVTPAPAP